MRQSRGVMLFIFFIISTILSACNSAGSSGSSNNNVSLTSITINANSSQVASGTAINITATGVFNNGTVQDLTKQVTWTSSDSNIVQITESGLAKGIAIGSSKITASYQGVSAKPFSLAVTDAVLKDIVVNINHSPTLAKGSAAQLIATGIFDDNTTQDLTNQVAWSSSNTDVVSITPDGIISGDNLGNAEVTASLFGGVASSPVTISVSPATLTGITVNVSNSIIANGTNSQLTAIGTFSDHSTQDLTKQVTWISSNSNILNVSSMGVAVAKAIGDSSITASYAGITSLPVTITVSDAVITRVVINSGATSLAKGTSTQLSLTGVFSDGSSQDLTNSAAWTSENNDVATVSNNGLVTGSIAGKSTNITAVYGSVSASISISVTDAILTKVIINTTDSSIAKGTKVQLYAVGILSDGTTQDLTNQAVWQSTAPNKVAVGVNGLASGVAVGSAGITAMFGGFTSSAFTMTVTDAVLTGVVVNATDSSIAKGTSSQLTATGTLSDGSTQDLTSQATWHSNNGSIVSVTANGVATGLIAGQSTAITAKFGGFTSLPVTITVSDAVVQSISLSITNNNPVAGTSAQLTATGTLSDGTTQDFTNQVVWSSDNNKIATISVDGKLAAIKAGSATVTAKLGSVSALLPITVTSAIIQSITISNLKDSFAKGTTIQLGLIARYTDGSTMPISEGITWQSSDNSIVNVTPDGVANADTEGSADITAFYQGMTSLPVTLTVTSATLKNIVITGNNALINGTNGQLTATGAFTDRSTHDVTNDVAWSSNNNNIVNVSQDGSISANSEGVATITAKKGTIYATYLVTVTKATPPTLTSILITGDNYMGEDSSNGLMATGIYSDQTYADLTTKVTWGTTNQFVATVTNNGLVTSTHYGTTDISASYGSVSSSFKMTVLYGPDTAVLNSVQLNIDPSGVLSVGQLAVLTATANYSDYTQRIISPRKLLFTSGQTAGTYDFNQDNGIIKALNPGYGVIGVTNYDAQGAVVRVN